MNLSPDVCYRAVRARDARYDGRFFTCVRTTGIYCRPTCPARPPKFENCHFVPTAAAAQAAAYRPCLRCHPESSPEFDAWQGTAATVSRALRWIESGALDEGDVGLLVERLQIGERQLRRLFRQHLGAAPITVAQTRRVLLAKQLLHQTSLSMIEIALASGFGSVRRFNETFQRMYGRPPSELRRRSGALATSPELTILLPYRPPYDWETLLRFFATRAIAGLEVVANGTYRRAIAVDGDAGTIAVRHAPAEHALEVTVRLPQLRSLATIIARVRRQFDLGADPLAIGAALASDPRLAPLIAARPGLRVPGCWDGWEAAVRAITGQQITLKSALKIVTRIVDQLGQPLENSGEEQGLTRLFPTPQSFTPEALANLGMPATRVATLVRVATALANDPHLFAPRRDLADAIAQLTQLQGIGPWTAHYIAMRAMGESDAFLAADVGLQKQYGRGGERLTEQELLACAEHWRPWRAYATLHLWMADGLVE